MIWVASLWAGKPGAGLGGGGMPGARDPRHAPSVASMGRALQAFVSRPAWNRPAVQSTLHTAAHLPANPPAAARWGSASCLASSAVSIRKPCPCNRLNIPLRPIPSRSTASKCAVLPKQREQQERWQGERKANWVLATPPVPFAAFGAAPTTCPAERKPMRAAQ